MSNHSTHIFHAAHKLSEEGGVGKVIGQGIGMPAAAAWGAGLFGATLGLPVLIGIGAVAAVIAAVDEFTD
jgi:hypothetical protein